MQLRYTRLGEVSCEVPVGEVRRIRVADHRVSLLDEMIRVGR